MGISEPKNLTAALSLLRYSNWFLGISLGSPPYFKPHHIVTTLYSFGTLVFFAVVYYVGNINLTGSIIYTGPPMALVMFNVLTYTNACVGLIVPLIAWIRFKGFNNYVDRLEKLDNTAVRLLGFEKNYKKLVLLQIYHILTICLIIGMITIIDWQLFTSGLPLVRYLAILITLHHPILIMLVSDFTFCGFINIIRRRFRDLNRALYGLTVLDFALYPSEAKLVVTEYKPTKVYSVHGIVNSKAKNWINKRDLFQTIRKTHFDLSKLAANMNSVFGLQNLMSMAVSLVMTTGLLYTIYSALFWKQSKLDVLKDLLPPVCWCIIYSFKILVVCHCCASVSDEATKSGQIIYDILGSVTDSEFRMEIQEFALQMIQNPVRFTACGFVTLDYTYVQGVIGSITTYLVILIQMGSTPSSPSTPVANTTDT